MCIATEKPIAQHQHNIILVSHLTSLIQLVLIKQNVPYGHPRLTDDMALVQIHQHGS